MRRPLGGALEDVLLPLLDPAYRLGTLLLGDPEAAQRRVQDAVAEAEQSKDAPPPDQAAAWFLGLVYDDCRPGRPVGSGEAPPLLRAVGRLPAEDRTALFLHYWLHLPPAEVAEATGIARDEITDRLNLVDRFGLGVRPRDVADAFEELTESAPYGFERRVLAGAESTPPVRRRDVGPLTWTGIAALAVAALLLVMFVGPKVDPAAAHKIAALAVPPAPSPTLQASPPPPSPSPAAAAPSPAPAAPPAVASTCSVNVPSEAAVSQPVAVSDVRVGTDTTRDRFVVQLAGPIPPFDLKPASGGWLLTIRGASPGGPADLAPGYPVLKEARSGGGAAGTAGWYLTVNPPTACPVVSTLGSPSRIVIDFPHA